MRLTAVQVQLARSTKIRVEKLRKDGTLIVFYVGAFVEHTDYKEASSRLGVGEELVTELIDGTLRKSGKLDTLAVLDLIAKQKPKPKFRIRPELGRLTTASIADTFSEALRIASLQTATRGSQVIEWEGIEWVCNLDVDFYVSQPDEATLGNFVESLHPIPAYYWHSQSKGCHLIYYGTDELEAAELASVAAYHITRRFPTAKCELLHRTRYPEATIVERTPDADVGSLKALLAEQTDTDCEAWLEERGWHSGQRLPHTDCPVNPSVRAPNNTPPVVVYDDHIFCYICQRDGRCCGSRRAGYFPISTLTANRVSTQIATCVRNRVHWGHARYVFRNQVQDEQLGRKLYSTLLKMQSTEDPRIPLVFTAGEPNGLVRYDGYWCDTKGTPLDLAKGSSILRSLPHCNSVAPNGAIAPDPIAIEWLSTNTDHSVRGYYAVTPIHGIMLTQFQELPSSKVFMVLQTATLAPEAMQAKQPEYVPSTHRMPTDEAWATLDAIFPGIDRKLIELLLVGRGCMEHRTGLPPMLFITGVTGSGKTSHMQVASAIAGDNVGVVHLNKDQDRFNNALLTAKRNAGFVFFDEFFKYASRSGLSDVEAMESLLSFTSDSVVYLIYIGSVPLGDLPLFIWADNSIPEAVQAHEQIGRRVFHYRLDGEVSWEQPLADAGIGEPKMLRANGNPEVIRACNAILSQVIDDWFTCPATDFAQVAEAMGVKKLRDSEAVQDKYRYIKELYDIICASKATPKEGDLKRWGGKGFKIAHSDRPDKLFDAFELCQKDHEKGTTRCNAIDECDLRLRVGLTQQARLEVKKHGNKYAMRFISIDGTLVNGELKL